MKDVALWLTTLGLILGNQVFAQAQQQQDQIQGELTVQTQVRHYEQTIASQGVFQLQNQQVEIGTEITQQTGVFAQQARQEPTQQQLQETVQGTVTFVVKPGGAVVCVQKLAATTVEIAGKLLEIPAHTVEYAGEFTQGTIQDVRAGLPFVFVTTKEAYENSLKPVAQVFQSTILQQTVELGSVLVEESLNTVEDTFKFIFGVASSTTDTAQQAVKTFEFDGSVLQEVGASVTIQVGVKAVQNGSQDNSGQNGNDQN